jgi:hypothetical protein
VKGTGITLQVYQNFWALKKGVGVNCHGFAEAANGQTTG